MVQTITDNGTFFFSADGVGGTVLWTESYNEAWVRRHYKHIYSPIFTMRVRLGRAKAIETFFGGTSFRRGVNNTLFFGTHEVCRWDFKLDATFDIQNTWNTQQPNRFTFPPKGNETVFAGEGNHTWNVQFFAYMVNESGGATWYETNQTDKVDQRNKPLYGFAAMLYHERGTAPPLSGWATATFRVRFCGVLVSKLEDPQEKPTMKYTGGYK